MVYNPKARHCLFARVCVRSVTGRRTRRVVFSSQQHLTPLNHQNPPSHPSKTVPGGPRVRGVGAPHEDEPELRRQVVRAHDRQSGVQRGVGAEAYRYV